MSRVAKGRELLGSAVSTLVGPAGKWRPRELFLAGLLLVAVFVYVPLRLTFGPGGGKSPDGPLGGALPPVRLNDVDPQGELLLPTPPYGIASLGRDPGKRNLFGFGTPSTPPPQPTPIPTPTPTPPPPPPPTPTPYTAPFTLLGLAEDTQHSRRIAFLKAGDELFVALEGDVIAVKGADGRTTRHVVKKIGLESVQVGPQEFEATGTITFPK